MTSDAALVGRYQRSRVGRRDQLAGRVRGCGVLAAPRQAKRPASRQERTASATASPISPAPNAACAPLSRSPAARPRFALAVFGVIAAIALAVCAGGLYGIIAYAVSQRTREIGVRVALGAEPSAVARLVLADSGRLVLVGVALGLVMALAATRVLAGFLYQVRPADQSALGGAVLLLVVVALIATLVPVRRALRIDPMDALRTD